MVCEAFVTACSFGLSGMPLLCRWRIRACHTLHAIIMPKCSVFTEDVMARMDCEEEPITAIEETALQKIEPDKIPTCMSYRRDEWRFPSLLCPFACPGVGVGNLLFQEVFVIVASVVKQRAK